MANSGQKELATFAECLSVEKINCSNRTGIELEKEWNHDSWDRGDWETFKKCFVEIETQILRFFLQGFICFHF